MKGNLKVSILDAKLNIDIHPREGENAGVWNASYNLMRDTETMGEYTILTEKNKDKICKYCTGQLKDPQAQQTPPPGDAEFKNTLIMLPPPPPPPPPPNPVCNSISTQFLSGARGGDISSVKNLCDQLNSNQDCCSEPLFPSLLVPMLGQGELTLCDWCRQPIAQR